MAKSKGTLAKAAGKKPPHSIVDHLSKALASIYALYINTLNCHWNVEDPRFLSLHQLFEEQYKRLAEEGDEVAEQIRQLGAQVPASLSEFAKQSAIDPIGGNLSADEMLKKLLQDHEILIAILSAVAALSEEAKDYGLSDLLGSLIREHEKSAWFIRSHLK